MTSCWLAVSLAAFLFAAAGMTIFLRAYPQRFLRTLRTAAISQPHIIYIIADDLGWNDVGYHGSDIHTPTIDSLAAGGMKLERFYVQPVCTPSRACLMSGRYITHTGLQHRHIAPRQRNALTLNVTILPEVLREHGYRNYMVGKWHLGLYAKQYLPAQRGFDEHFGILSGMADHYTRKMMGYYTLVENGKPYWDTTTYSTHLYVQKTTEYVEHHLKEYPEKPMFFLYVSWQAVHIPNQVPKIYSDRYRTSGKSAHQQVHAGMTTAMDEGIGNITELFKKHGIWDNTVMFFSTDNGGDEAFGASNHPLREGKGTLYDGGIRGVAFAHGRGIRPASVSHGLMHISDIFPTIVHIAQKSSPQENVNIPKVDGFNMWDMLSKGEKSPRQEVHVNIDPLTPRYGASQFPKIYDTRVHSAIISQKWKLITGNPDPHPHNHPPKITDKSVQLFDLESDESEKHNLASERADVVESLLARLREHNRTAVTPYYPPGSLTWPPGGVMLPVEDNPKHLI